MKARNSTVRQSLSLPSGMEVEECKQREFFDLAERFRAAADPEEVKRLGDRMGRMVFGD